MLNLLCGPTLLSVHDYWKNQSFDYVDLSWQRDISVFCNMLYKSVIAFLQRSKHLLSSWLQSQYAAILEHTHKNISLFQLLFPFLFTISYPLDGRVEECTFMFSVKNSNISMGCWKSIDRILDPTKKRYLMSKGKGEPETRWQEWGNCT